VKHHCTNHLNIYQNITNFLSFPKLAVINGSKDYQEYIFCVFTETHLLVCLISLTALISTT